MSEWFLMFTISHNNNNIIVQVIGIQWVGRHMWWDHSFALNKKERLWNCTTCMSTAITSTKKLRIVTLHIKLKSQAHRFCEITYMFMYIHMGGSEWNAE